MSSSTSSNEEMILRYKKASENVCMWHQKTSDVCDSPRSCYECLNSSPHDCVVTSAGLCTTMDEYVWQADYRLNPSNDAFHYFPSTNTTYCEDSDPVCVACKANRFVKSVSGMMEPSQFCVGTNSCVCVGYCESPLYVNNVVSAHCAKASASTPATIIGDVVAIVILCSVISVIVYLWWRRRLRKRRPVREEVHDDRPLNNGPLLPLVGWKKYRADLMANQTPIVGVNGSEGYEATAVAPDTVSYNDNEHTTPLTNLQIAALTIEFEDPQHPFTAVTRTGRRRATMDNINVVRPRPSHLGSNNDNEADDDERDSRMTPYAILGERMS